MEPSAQGENNDLQKLSSELKSIRKLDLVILGHTCDDEAKLKECLIRDSNYIVKTISGKRVDGYKETKMNCYTGTLGVYEAFCIVLTDPTWDFLKKCLKIFLEDERSGIDNKMRTRSVFYCGHGLLDGSVLLCDDDVISFSDFSNAVFPTDLWRTVDHQLILYLNCCFALRMASFQNRI